MENLINLTILGTGFTHHPDVDNGFPFVTWYLAHDNEEYFVAIDYRGVAIDYSDRDPRNDSDFTPATYEIYAQMGCEEDWEWSNVGETTDYYYAKECYEKGAHIFVNNKFVEF